MNNKEIECYIHIPFCIEKCSYCDFLSFKATEAVKHSYVDSLIREIVSKSNENLTFSTIFIGGGTPSSLSNGEIKRILKALKDNYNISKNAEISIEANPCTITKKKLEEYLEAGINRISIGCQSMDDKLLRELGRLHDSSTFLQAVKLSREAGFNNINADLMFAIPDQTSKMWIETLEKAAELEIPHISAYSLILEEGTRLYNRRDSLKLCSEEECALMYEDTLRILRQHGFERYEISNYSKKGYECRHNIGYWTGAYYKGFGIGASSYENNMRYKNTEDIKKYISIQDDYEDARCDIIELDNNDLYSEFVILGLRLTNGISVKEFEKRFDKTIFEVFDSELKKHIELGTLIYKNNRIYIPETYMFVSNSILSDFV